LHIRDRLEFINDNGILYVNGEYLINATVYFSDMWANENKGYCLINLSKNEDEAVAMVPVENIFPPGFLEETVYDDPLPPPHPSRGIVYFHKDSKFAEKAYHPPEWSWRWYCRIESYDPLKLSDPVVTVHEEGNRSDFYVGETDRNIFVAGRLLTLISDDPDFYGLEVGVYPAGGGEEIKALRMWASNQITYAKKNGTTWFGKNIWIENPDYTWDYSGKPEAYMLDEETARLYRVSANGTMVEIPPIRGE
jgi:hypothetical protein